MKMDLFKKAKSVLLVGLAAVMFSTTAYGTDVPETNSEISEHGGAFLKNAITGEVTYLPEPEIETYSTEIEGNYPAGNIYADSDFEIDPEVILLAYMNDNRIKVEDPASRQEYRMTVNIHTTTTGAGPWVGTGFLIRSNVVVTAGHTIFDEGYGGDKWVTSATITPAITSKTITPPYGEAKAIAYICGGDWAAKHDYDDDWGIIILDEPIGDKTSWFGLHWQSNAYSGIEVKASGYNNSDDLYRVTGTISASKSKTLESKDMFVVGGMSGGPCYIYSSEYGYQAIGIISHYLSFDEKGLYHSDTIFRRIDKVLYNKLLSYCDQYAP